MSTRLRIYCLFLVSFFVMAGARAEDWPQSVWIPSVTSLKQLEPVNAVSANDFRYDLDTLERTFQAAYSGWPVNGPAIHSAFAQLKTIQGSQFTSLQICNMIGDKLLQIPDGHLYVTGYPFNFDCGSSSRRGQVGKNLTTKTWDYFPQAKPGVNVPVIAISTMPWRDDSSWNGLVPQVESIYSTEKALIIDLRGNGGGDMERGQQMARRLFGIQDDSVQLSPPSTLYMPHSPEAFAVAGNSSRLKVLVDPLIGRPVSKDDESVLQTFLYKFSLSLAGKLPAPKPIVIPPFSYDPAKVFKGPIRILVDANCASSCEWTVMFFERHPNAKVVGERTWGAFHFDNVGLARVPKSHLFVGMPTISYIFSSGHPLDWERKGLVPDILVPPGSDALDYALKDIAKTVHSRSGEQDLKSRE